MQVQTRVPCKPIALSCLWGRTDRTEAAEASKFHDFTDSNMDNNISLAAATGVGKREEPGMTRSLPAQGRECVKCTIPPHVLAPSSACETPGVGTLELPEVSLSHADQVLLETF